MIDNVSVNYKVGSVEGEGGVSPHMTHHNDDRKNSLDRGGLLNIQIIIVEAREFYAY